MAFKQSQSIQLTRFSPFQLMDTNLVHLVSFKFKYFSQQKSECQNRTPNTITVSFNFYCSNFQPLQYLDFKLSDTHSIQFQPMNHS